MDEHPFTVDGTPHEVGNLECGECWTGFPRPCEEPDCVGLVHAAFGDENYDCDYWLYYKCDVCGSTSRPD